MSTYRIGTFNCKNYIYDNNPEKFKWIKEIISKANMDMLLLQEFASGDKNRIDLPNGWNIELYHGKWYSKDLKDKVTVVTNHSIDPQDDTNGEYMRNPNNDNGYAILWDNNKFNIQKYEENILFRDLLRKRDSNTRLARPPQIDFFSTKNNNSNIFAVMNTHLTFSGKFDLYKRIIQGFRPDFDKASKKVKARVNEMSELLGLYNDVNNRALTGKHYTTILGGDFNLAVDYLREIDNAPKGFPSTTTEYNKIKRNDVTEQYNQIYAENAYKTTLHKTYKEDPSYDYKYHSYDHFIINQEGCKTEVFDSVKGLKEFFDDSKGDKSPKNDEHYNKLSDHLPVVITVNL